MVRTEPEREDTTITQIEDAATSNPDGQRQRVRRRRPQTKKQPRWLAIGGYGLIVAGLAVLAWVAWQFWGTNWVSKGRQAEVVTELQEKWDDGRGTVETDFGQATGILRVPRFGADYAVPILEGTTDEVLAAGIGHDEDTAGVGERGNFALAAHRVTHGEPFADFPELREGDLVEVETVNATYTYELDNGGTDLIVPFTADWVLDPLFPVNPDVGGVTAPGKPGDQIITLVTCSEIFHTDNRSVVFGHLVEVEPKIP